MVLITNPAREMEGFHAPIRSPRLNSSTGTCEITFRVHVSRHYRNKYDNLKSRRNAVLRSDKNTIHRPKENGARKGAQSNGLPDAEATGKWETGFKK